MVNYSLHPGIKPPELTPPVNETCTLWSAILRFSNPLGLGRHHSMLCFLCVWCSSIPRTSEITQYLFFLVWLVSLSAIQANVLISRYFSCCAQLTHNSTHWRLKIIHLPYRMEFDRRQACFSPACGFIIANI